MIFVVDAHGGITKIGASSIYQGSVGASQIILLAPLPASLSVTVGFTLPTGTSTTVELLANGNMTSLDLSGIITDTEKGIYNAWVYTIQESVTEFAGTVTVQFFCHSSASEVLTTYAAEIEVLPGVAIELPETPTQTIYDQILSALSELRVKINSLETSVEEKNVIQYVTTLPTTNINSQAFYVIGKNVYIYNNGWRLINEVIEPITSQSQASASARKLYLLNGELYAYINNAFTRILNASDYTTLYNLANTANANATQANNAASNANTVAGNAQSTANTANNNASEALSTANEALNKAQEALNSVTSFMNFGGSVAFANLPTPSASVVNTIYNVTDAFTTTSSFVEGSGKSYPAGTNVAIVLYNGAYKYDVLSGFVDLSGYQAKLVSGENIKTINGVSILGSGNIDVEGTQGEQCVGIANITVGNPVVGSEYTTTPLTITLTDGTSTTVNASAKNGEKGADGTDGTDGIGIESISKTATNGLVDTYTIYLTNGTTTTFTVTNGNDGVGIEAITSGSPQQGTGNDVNYTITPIVISLSSGTNIEEKVRAKNGTDGVSIEAITSGSPQQGTNNYADYTVTPVTIEKSDGNSVTLQVLAKNGGDNIITLTTRTIAIADLEAGVYLWDYEGAKTLDWYSGIGTIYQNPILLQVTQNGTKKDFYLFDNAGGYDEASNRLVYGSVDVAGNNAGMCYAKTLKNIPDAQIDANNIVDLTSFQIISGNKTFTGATSFSNAFVGNSRVATEDWVTTEISTLIEEISNGTY